MVGRGELTDKGWEQIYPLLPNNGRTGAQWKGHRKVINGHLVEVEDRSPLARLALPLRSLADLLLKSFVRCGIIYLTHGSVPCILYL